MASHPVLQITEGEWTSRRCYEILGLQIPTFLTSDPALWADYISSFQTRPDDVFVVTYPKSESKKAFDDEYNGPWEFFAKLFMKGNAGWCSWNDHVLDWWQHKEDTNVLFLKYEDLLKDLPSHVRMIAEFLNKPLSAELIGRIAEQCTFKGMARNRASFEITVDGIPVGRKLRKGIVGDWKNYFAPELNERFEEEVLGKLKGSGLEFDYEL